MPTAKAKNDSSLFAVYIRGNETTNGVAKPDRFIRSYIWLPPVQLDTDSVPVARYWYRRQGTFDARSRWAMNGVIMPRDRSKHSDINLMAKAWDADMYRSYMVWQEPVVVPVKMTEIEKWVKEAKTPYPLIHRLDKMAKNRGLTGP